jgi:hypothetical protein
MDLDMGMMVSGGQLGYGVAKKVLDKLQPLHEVVQ